MVQPTDNGTTDSNKTIDLNRLIQVVVSRWYVVALTIIIALTVNFLILRYTKPLYNTSISIKFDDEKSSQLNDLFRYGKVAGRIENQLKTEAEIIQSRALALKTLTYLNKRISYSIKGQIITSGVYPFPYFDIDIIWLDSADINTQYSITFIDQSTFILEDRRKSTEKTHHLNDTIVIGNSLVTIRTHKKDLLRAVLNNPIYFTIDNMYANAISLSHSIGVEPKKGTSILDITFTSDIPQFTSDYLNALVSVYIQETVNSKTRAAEQTLIFIENQIEELAKKVDTAQSNLAGFQAKNKGMSPEDIGKAEFDKLTRLDAEHDILLLKKRLLETLQTNIQDAKNRPLELVIFDSDEDIELSKKADLLNELIINRISLSGKNMPASPIMLENEQKIKEVKKALANNIQLAKTKLDERINSTSRLITEIEAKLSNLPDKQKRLLNLERSFKVNEKIYGYLMEKRLETLISRSSITANVSTIDYALLPTSPIYPDTKKNTIVAFIIGLLGGVGYIFLIRLLYNRIPDKETIEAVSKIPVIGVIKKIEHEKEETGYEVSVFKSPKSVFSESIRGIRTNINFLLKGEDHKVVCITSSVSGEGKTFCTINLAASLTMLNKKVVVVGCDLRRPKIHQSFKNVSNDIGLSTYLIGKNSQQEVITETEYENLFVIPAGPTPPNPAELLQTDKMVELCDKLKEEFDYVFFDTAPVGLVSDSFPLMKYADINIYIIRAQYSKRDFAVIPDRLKADNNIENIYTVLNSYDNSSRIYGSIYKTEYGGYYGGGGYYYYGGYYGRSNYGYYSRKYYSAYQSGYYSDSELPNPWWKFWNFKKKKKK